MGIISRDPILRIIKGDTRSFRLNPKRVMKRDSRSLDCSSHTAQACDDGNLVAGASDPPRRSPRVIPGENLLFRVEGLELKV